MLKRRQTPLQMLGLVCLFYTLKGCGNLLGAVVGPFVPTAFAHFVSLCHILVVPALFHYDFICYGHP